MQAREVVSNRAGREHTTINAIPDGHTAGVERQMLEMLMESSSDGIYFKDPQGRFTRLNRAMLHRLGLARPDQAIGFTAHSFFAAGYADRLLAHEQAVMQTGVPLIGKEECEILPGGGTNWVATTIIPVYDAAGAVAGTFGVSSDISERKKDQMRLEESEALYRSIIDTSPDAIALAGLDGTLLLCNRRCASMYGYSSPADVLGSSVFDFIAPEEKGKIKQLMLGLFRAGTFRDLHHTMLRRDGSRFPVEMSASLVRQSGGKPKSVLIIIREITERVTAEKAAAFQRYMLDSLMESIPDSIYFKDLESKFTLVNQALARSVGLSTPAEAIGKSDFDFFSEELARLSYNDEQEIIRTGLPVLDKEERELWPDGRESWVLTTKMPLKSPDGRTIGTFGMSRDISERKKVERMKNEFVSTVSHELRTPLTSIRGSLGLIAGGVAGEISPQVKSMVDIAYNNSERLVRLINDILDMEKIESGKMVFELRPTPLLPLILQAMEANAAFGEEHGVHFTLAGNMHEVIVNIDSDRMMQVLTNLLSNAAKFSPQGAPVELSLQQHHERVRVLVADHGPGISPHFSSRIFQKFAQADSSDTRQKGGTGLGLSISKAIVEQFGGELGFTTTPGQGTTFYIDIPVWQSYTAGLQSAETIIEKAPSHILICEDDPDIARLLSLMLAQGGFTSDIAGNALQVRELLRQKSYDAMTLDLMLPGEDGISLLRELRDCAATHNLPVIVVSAKARLGKKELSGSAAAVVDWINKPIDQDQLLLSLRRATHHQARPPRILHVEDDPDVVQVVAMIVGDIAEVSYASTLAEAHTKLAEEQYDLVILDYGLPDGHGPELLPHLHFTGPLTSVMLFSAHDVSPETAGSVDASLVKTRTSNRKLLSTITELINKKERRHPPAGLPAHEGNEPQ